MVGGKEGEGVRKIMATPCLIHVLKSSHFKCLELSAKDLFHLNLKRLLVRICARPDFGQTSHTNLPDIRKSEANYFQEHAWIPEVLGHVPRQRPMPQLRCDRPLSELLALRSQRSGLLSTFLLMAFSSRYRLSVAHKHE